MWQRQTDLIYELGSQESRERGADLRMGSGSGSHDEAQEVARNYVVVLVSGIHNATLQALEYAETLNPTDLRAVSFGLDSVSTEKLADRKSVV